MRKRRRQSVCLLLLLFSFLFQWESTQMLAWANMIMDFSGDRDLSRAVADTFSGEKPCAMCRQLTEEKTASPDQSSFQALSFQPADLCSPESMVWNPRQTGCRFCPKPRLLLSGTDRLSPLLPPPRSFSC